MTAQEIYIKETGNKPPDHPYSYHDWYIDYVDWLEKKVEESRPSINIGDHNAIELPDP